ncbi:enoyl-acyl carrier reductase, putative [Plasmodium knowlesi strain H]|uniref:Enoyl-acyl carrier reductase, putative n=3 Tax=Plasmodium knowlesi TaxID=5850 RepID=A0A5K1VQY1_PLAKH|nr:enoyl-acyl carrier reductase, putative [Plasmodium knowlesi strain H]OTN64629.1 putative Enoyl-acyl carrier reductase [Plasmodium knowlesi]CAA9989174.1 enoyl-acyl carrier reductase, putative [Plasmodium knowlesi strain H]SBO27394.1 enoyl-acyl carrier reductase, putative [Plasmodium knowlesi strain H]SBO27496.1 enoyl-acyl carrier reductase, putative [Plasmodium knowlesi strain H]VVS78648.1 enoyl-acyl carrier reductase, putative [Plasmodium knowlesi strain H]|eukprot:XP_002261521.1 enoyl-acyl carrier reductase, putative [Plasmodium knowlesi strain H]
MHTGRLVHLAALLLWTAAVSGILRNGTKGGVQPKWAIEKRGNSREMQFMVSKVIKGVAQNRKISQHLSHSEKMLSEQNGQGEETNKKGETLGDICFIAGVGDTNGYGWGIAKELSKKNVKVILGVWPPVYNIFMKNLHNGKFDNDMEIGEGRKMDLLDILPFDAAFDSFNDIDEETRKNKRYANLESYSIEEVANLIYKKYGKINMLVHSLANGREVEKSLLDTSRNGYLDALSKSSYSLIALCKYFCPIMHPQSSVISLTYYASQKVVPGYGGGMSSAKAALESDTRTLAYHLGRKHKIRINTISAGPLKSRAATAIKKANPQSGENETEKKNLAFIDYAIEYSEKYAPLQQKLYSTDVGAVAAFLLSKESRAVTGQTIYVDNGLNIMFGPDDLFQDKGA